MFFVTFTTGNYTDMTRNLVTNFEKVLAPCDHKLILICMDAQAEANLSYCKELPWIVMSSRNLNDQSQISTFDSPSFNKLNSFKPMLLRELIETYDELYWIDSDLVFYQDPVPDILAANTELIFQQDNDRDEDRICTGNFYMKKTDGVLKFFDTWLDALSKQPGKNEQLLLNHLIHSTYGGIRSIPWVNISVFPPEKYQRGLDAFRHGWHSRPDKVVVHANFMEGFETKKRALASIGMWNI
jgi:hypothetical protein